MINLPIPDFPTGIMRGRFHPSDGNLYMCGMSAWGTQQILEPGGLYRMRYTGEPAILPIEINALTTGMKLTFAAELDKTVAENVKNYSISTWRLVRSSEYGSDHYDERSIRVQAAELGDDRRTVLLRINNMKPVWQMQIEYNLRSASGLITSGKVHSTIHNLNSLNM